MHKNRRNQQVPNPERQGGCEDEAVPTGEVDVGEDAKAGGGDGGEEEGRYASEDWVGDYKHQNARRKGGELSE